MSRRYRTTPRIPSIWFNLMIVLLRKTDPILQLLAKLHVEHMWARLLLVNGMGPLQSAQTVHSGIISYSRSTSTEPNWSFVESCWDQLRPLTFTRSCSRQYSLHKTFLWYSSIASVFDDWLRKNELRTSCSPIYRRIWGSINFRGWILEERNE